MTDLRKSPESVNLATDALVKGASMAADAIPVAFGCRLVADDTTIGLFQEFSFPTSNSFVFKCPPGVVDAFLNALLQAKGSLPYKRWTLTLFDSKLRAMRKYTWGRSTVTRIRVSAVDKRFLTALNFSVELAVPEVAQTSKSAEPTKKSFPARPDGTSAFRLRIDGVDFVDFSIIKIDAFDVRCRGLQPLVFRASPEARADPFRGWLNDGNSARTGTVEYLSMSLRNIIFGIRFSGLRVRSVTPPISSLSNTEARIDLTYVYASL